MTVPSGYGTWTAKPVCKKLPRTARNSMNQFTTSRFILPNRTSRAQGPTPSPKSLYDTPRTGSLGFDNFTVDYTRTIIIIIIIIIILLFYYHSNCVQNVVNTEQWRALV